jgi:DNA repair protein RadD
LTGKTYSLRPYQQQAADTAVHMLRTQNNPFIVVMATGAGKSLVIADICRQLNEPVLVLQPSKEILEQNYDKLRSYGIEDVSIYSASLGSKEISKFTYATIGSIYKKPELFQHFKYVIIDECHLVNPKNLQGMYTTFLRAIGCRTVCGLTATPYRLCQKFFREGSEMYYTAHLKMINRIYPFFFKNIVYKIETADLIRDGYLAEIEYFNYSKGDEMQDLEVNSTGADFTTESLEKFWTDARLHRLADVIQHIDKNCKRNLIFCSSLRQANRTKEMLEMMGIRSLMVDGKTPMKERSAMVQLFKDGVFKHMINVGVFTTGFDVPVLDNITLARPTMSLALYYQMVGRGVRIDPDDPFKKLKVWDLVGVTKKLGKVETIRLTKEDDGFRDKVVSEAGTMTEVPLFEFHVKKKSKYEKFNNQTPAKPLW